MFRGICVILVYRILGDAQSDSHLGDSLVIWQSLASEVSLTASLSFDWANSLLLGRSGHTSRYHSYSFSSAPEHVQPCHLEESNNPRHLPQLHLLHRLRKLAAGRQIEKALGCHQAETKRLAGFLPDSRYDVLRG